MHGGRQLPRDRELEEAKELVSALADSRRIRLRLLAGRTRL